MSVSNLAVLLTARLFRALASAFPHEFKNVYGEEMLQTAGDAINPTWRRYGVTGLLRLLLDVALRLPVEYASELRRDVRHSLRTLAASPAFTGVALVSLVLGIGVASCAYSEVNGLLRDVAGVREPRQLVAVHNPISYPTYKRFRELDDIFISTMAYVAPVPFGVSVNGHTERTWGHIVTPSYFATLGVRPRLGTFFPSDERPGQAPNIVISYRFWQQRFGSDPAVVGRTILLNGQSCMIIGVGPRDFLGASPMVFGADLWLPVTADPRAAPELQNGTLERRDLAMFQMLGRLRPGVTSDAAEAALNAVAQQIAATYGDPDRDRKEPRVQLLDGGRALPLRKQDVPFFRQFLMVLGSLLLLIACANVANMMLARAADRRKEIAVRLALGASRARLIRQLLTESVVLALGAAPFAFLLSVVMMRRLSNLAMPQPIPIVLDLNPDWRVLAFTFTVTAFTGVLFGLAPAFRATRTDLISSLKDGAVRFSRHRAVSLRNALVLSQIAASLMLLLITGYMGLGIQNTLGVQEGFDPKDLSLVSLDPVREGYSAARAADFFDKLTTRLRQQPFVTAVCLTDTLPAAVDGNPGVRFSIPKRSVSASVSAHWARKHIVGRDYFETTGIRILSGRGFRKEDQTDTARTIVVSQEAVRQFWNSEDPVAQRIQLSNAEPTGGYGAWPGTLDFRSNISNDGESFQVIGVARDVSEDIIASKRHPAVYFPLRPADYGQPSLRGVTLLTRTRPGFDVISAVRREVQALDPNITISNARTMRDHIAQFMSALKAASWTYAFMGFFGLVLASVGLAGITAHSVAKRAHEIGVRMALGAQQRDVLALVMKEGVILTAIGTVIGLALALSGIRALSALFFSVASIQGYDPVLLIGGPCLLITLALLACYLPARRSTRIDPVATLRLE
ncbi:MAG: ABC transporter permease [Acidobacteriaceae bacterium]|nr:ABC transporter permease [Acidobacteriaceae bacterium]